MLKLMGVGAAGMAAASLAACTPATPPPPTTIPIPTVTIAPTNTPISGLASCQTAATIEIGQAAYGAYTEWHSASPVTPTVRGPTAPDTDPWLNAAKAALDRFHKKYPEITIDFQQIVGTDLDTKVAAALASKRGPDIIIEADREGQFARNKVIRPIPEDVISLDYIKNHHFYEVRPLKDGLLYWLHTGVMGPILYCNKALLAEKGLKSEDTPKTWDEFAKFCQPLTKVENGQMTQAGFGFNYYARYIWNDMIYQQKPHCYSQTKSNVNSPESEKAWQTLVDFYDKYKINDRAFLAFDEGFGKGKSAFTQVWTWFGSTLEANYPDIDWAPVTYPTFTGQGPYGRHDYDGTAWMVTTFAQGDKEKAAWELFKFDQHEYQGMVERHHANGLYVSTWPHPDYDQAFADVAKMAKPALISPFGIFLMRQFTESIPDELLDAARMDGAGDFRTFWQIVLPLCTPALSANAIFHFIWIWNDFLWPLLVTDNDIARTLPVGVALFANPRWLQTNLVVAGSMLVLLPLVVVYFIFQRAFVQGIILTGMKY